MTQNNKDFDAVEFMRQQRDKLSEILSKMSKEEVLEYFKNRKSQLTIKPSA
jgi:hypothetical protein